MTLFSTKTFDAMAGSLAGVTFVDQWDSRVAKVGRKVFALINAGTDGQIRIVFKCPEQSFEILTSLDGISQAPYFAKRQWVSVAAGSDLPESDLEIYIIRSHAIVAGSLTKKLQRELGIIPA